MEGELRIFVVNAFGGKATNGSFRHYTVAASSVQEAIELIRASRPDLAFDRFEPIDEFDDLDVDMPEVLEEAAGLYLKPP